MPPLPSKPILCLDFDGCIHSYTSGWREPHLILDPPNPGAIEALLGYLDHFCVCIHSSRLNRLNGDGEAALRNMKAMVDWLVRWGVLPELIRTFSDYQPDGLCEDRINLVRTKPPAQVTIDDRGWTFDGTWPTVEQLKAFRPWNRRDVSGRAVLAPPASGADVPESLADRDLPGVGPLPHHVDPKRQGNHGPENVPIGPHPSEPAAVHEKWEREMAGRYVSAIAADRVTPFSIQVASPFPDDELQRRYRALDLIMKITAERAGIEGDPFSTENIEAIAEYLHRVA